MLGRWEEQPGSWHAHIAGIMRRVVNIAEEPRYRRGLVGEVQALKRDRGGRRPHCIGIPTEAVHRQGMIGRDQR